MNRAERRRLQKHGDVNGLAPTITTGDYLHYYTLSICDALYCEGIDRDIIRKVFDKIKITMDCLRSGHIDVHDLETMCYEEVGINFIKSLKGKC